MSAPVSKGCGRPRCPHRLVWVKTTAGKMTQARECTTDLYRQRGEQLAAALRAPVPEELLRLVRKAVEG